MANFGKYTKAEYESLLRNDIMTARSGCEHPERAGDSYCDVYYSAFDKTESMRYRFGTGDDNRANFLTVASARVDERLQELGQTPMKRRDVKYTVSLVCTLPEQVPPRDEKNFFDAFQAFCENYLGADNMYCYAVHYHETRPHAQAYAMPVVNGRMDSAHWHNRKRYQEFHGRLQAFMDQAMGYHVEIELDEDNPRKKTSNKSINTLKDKTYKNEIKRLKTVNQELEAERKYWLRRTQDAEAVVNVLKRAGMLDKIKSSIEDSDRLTEAELNTQYMYYHGQRIEAGKARTRKQQNEL